MGRLLLLLSVMMAVAPSLLGGVRRGRRLSGGGPVQILGFTLPLGDAQDE